MDLKFERCGLLKLMMIQALCSEEYQRSKVPTNHNQRSWPTGGPDKLHINDTACRRYHNIGG